MHTKETLMYVDIHVIASLLLIATIFALSGVGIRMLRRLMKQDAERSR